MKTRKGFILLDKSDIRDWIMSLEIDREISYIQNHHTYLPDYKSFSRNPDHFKWLDVMKNYHVIHNGWNDIAQNITTFPDGKIAICRPLTKIPAGIKGYNHSGICIENLGNFDIGNDEMTLEHKITIVHLNAVLCEKFNLQPDTDTVIYHNWFQSKSCPGSNFFGGNTRDSAIDNFYPVIQKEITAIEADSAEDRAVIGYGMVTASALNVRSGPSTQNEKISILYAGNILSIYEKNDGWLRIDTKNRWVSQKFVQNIFKGLVTATALNVRSGPGTNYRILDSISKDTAVTVYEKDTGWYKIDLNEKWVSGNYVNLRDFEG